jgi:hypothetical protein
LTAISACHSASVVPASLFGDRMPALLTRISTRPKPSRIAAMPVDREGFARVAEFRGHAAERLAVAVDQRDPRARCRETAGDRLADAAGGAGDHGSPAGEFHAVPS